MADQDTKNLDTEDLDTEEQKPETGKRGGGLLKMVIAGVGIFVILVAAQIVVPPLNDMLYGDADEAIGEGTEDELMEAEEEFLAEQPIDFSELDPAIYTPLDPPLIVSLFDSAGTSRYLQLSVQAMSRDQDAIDDIRVHAPALRNSFLFLLSEWTFEDIATLEGKEQLRTQMLDEAQAIMEANTGEPAIEEIYFTSLVVQ